MNKFDPAKAIPGTILQGIDASSPVVGRDVLKQSRIDDQHRLPHPIPKTTEAATAARLRAG